MKFRFMRNSSLVVASVVLAAGIAACSSGSSSDTSATSAPPVGNGKVLNLTLENHAWVTEIQKYIPDFTKQTGIKVSVNVYDDAQIADLYNVKLNAASSDVDVVMFRPLQNTKQFAQNNWLADLTPYIDKTKGYDWNDYWASARGSVTVGKKVIGVPLASETGVMYYRKDLLAKTGMPYPKTMNDLKKVLAKIHTQNPGVFAFAGRGDKSAAVTQLSSFIYSYGGDWVDKNGKADIDSAAAKKAYALYGGLINKYGPPGEIDMNWPQVMGLFQQGLVAFYPEGSSNYASTVDPTASKVVKNVGVGPIPAGSAGSRPYNITAMGMGINKASKNKDAAWEFIKWATSKKMTLKLQEAGVPGARTSVWDNPKSTASLPKDLLATIKVDSKNGVDHDRPVVVNVDAVRAVVGAPVIAAIQGKDVNAAADAANKAFQALLDQEPKAKK